MVSQTRVKMHHKHRLIWIILFLIIVLILIFLFEFYKNIKHSSALVYKNDGADVSKLIEKKEPISILVLGVDTGSAGRTVQSYHGNSDTIIMVTLNPKTKTTTMMSIPRDSLAQIMGITPENMQKINAAYSIGNSTMAKQTVSQLLNVPVNYFVTMNMGSLENLVNDVGGITINSPFTIRSNNDTGYVIVHKGKVHLNGFQALTYVRMRHQDPRGCYGREVCQRQVIEALLPKLVSWNGIIHYKSIMKSLVKGTQTDLDFKDITNLAKYYHSCKNNIHSTYIQGKTAWINGSSYQILSTPALQQASDILRKQLDLNKEPVNNAETRLNALNPTFFTESLNTTYNTYGYDSTFYV